MDEAQQRIDAEGTPDASAGPGRKLGHYVIEGKIGAGGMGVVFKARDTRLDRSVALKLLPPSLTDDDKARKRFLVEARAISKMDHPNVCTIYDIGETADHQLYFSMPCYDGRALKDYIACNSLSMKQSVEVMIQICRAIGAAHKQDVIHRDIKPANIRLTDDGTVKVLDFGIAKLSGLELTRTGQLVGTVPYMSPEQLQTDPLDHRTDIWSLGVVFYELITGRLPFDGGNTLAISRAVLDCAPPPISSMVIGMSPVADVIISRTLRVRPSERYNTIDEMIRDLERLLEHIDDEPTSVTESAAADTVAAPPPSDMGTTLNSIALELEKHLGSGAHMLVNTMSHQTSTLDELVRRLEAELPDETTRTDFRREVSAIRKGPSGQKRPTKRILILTAGIAAMLVTLVMMIPPWRFYVCERVTSLLPSHEMVRGVEHNRIVLGMTAAFSGSARELGRSMQRGIECHLNEVNDAGGIRCRKIELKVMDDKYEPEVALSNLGVLLDPTNGVFALIGNVGTPTAKAMLPEILEDGTILFGTFSGAQLLRREPPDQYVFNYRASYAEETEALVQYFVKTMEIEPESIGVFYQDDSYGLDGLSGVVRALRRHDVKEPAQTATYKRNTAQVQEAVEAFSRKSGKVHAIIIISTYQASAAFTKAMRDAGYEGQIANVSFVGSQALAEEFKTMGPKYGEGVIISQVVPDYNSYAEGVTEYRKALEKYFPNESPDFVSLEGYIAARILCKALKINGRRLNTQRLIDSLQSIEGLDIGIGPSISFSKSNHQASHYVWGTKLTADGSFEQIRLME